MRGPTKVVWPNYARDPAVRWAVMLLVAAGIVLWSGQGASAQEAVRLSNEAGQQKLQCGGRAETLVKAAGEVAEGTTLPSDPLCELPPELPALSARRSCQIVSPQMTCEACLETFVQELDRRLDGDTDAPHPEQLVDKTFPLKGCDAERTLNIARKSKYLRVAKERDDDYFIYFSDSKKWSFNSAYAVSFRVNKRSGNTHNEDWYLIK